MVDCVMRLTSFLPANEFPDNDLPSISIHVYTSMKKKKKEERKKNGNTNIPNPKDLIAILIHVSL